MKELTETLCNRLSREITLLGEEKVLKLINASVTIIGLGGVGGYICEMLARAGIGKMHLVDCDIVSDSNINRQIIALTNTVGMKKTELIAERIKYINPECDVTYNNIFVDAENASQIIDESNTNIIIDAIDNVTAKIALIKYAKEKGIYIFSVMGAGNKLDSSKFKVADIQKTSVCGLARAMRRELKARGIDHLDVLFSEEPVIKIGQRTPASICYMPAVAGIKVAEFIIKKIINE